MLLLQDYFRDNYNYVSQVRTWNRVKDEIPNLVDAFFVNDPYYPRARLTDPLYRDFRDG